ncbi:hypothetical protein AB0A71_41195 [Kitasatospora aureofaciens]|uniref:hypothetical protein n=1 Tax=Kitasatospora aureofaciens TaxID=1894 RepID=UPI0033EED40B
MNPQDLRDASAAGRAVAAGMRKDLTQDFGQMPDLGLPNWVFAGPAKAAVKDLGDHIERVTTTMLEHAAGVLIDIANSYKTTDANVASSLAVPAPEGQG